MTDQEKQLQDLIVGAKSIVITSHMAPDPDAVASSLLLTETLKLNFPDKKVALVLEEEPAQNLQFLHGFEGAIIRPLADVCEEVEPELIIITDADNFGRVSRGRADNVRAYIQAHHVTVAAIDHHESDDPDHVAVIINRRAPAAAQEVYRLCFMVYGWKKPDGYATTTLLGIVVDTVRFRYANPLHRETFEIVNDLLDTGADIQLLEDRLDRYTDDQIEVLAHITANTHADGDHTYSYVDDAFFKGFTSAGKSYADFKSIIGMYNDEFIRKIAERKWGYIVYQDAELPETYKVSFRAITGAKDVRAIASKLGGGGHIPAAAATFKAVDITEALAKVKQALD